MTTTTEPWTSWRESRPALSRAAHRLLESELGPLTAPPPPPPVTDVTVPASLLPPAARAALAAVVGPGGVLDDDEHRARHSGGQSYVDLVRRRAGDVSAAPDAVVLPADAGQVSDVLAVCAAHAVAVVPWGGGTSVVGGLDRGVSGATAVVALDLRRLDRLRAVDPVSLLATFEAGVRTPAAEAMLAEHGLTLGHVPQSFERATLGGYVVTRSAGQASTGVGRIDDLVAGLHMATPSGELVLPALPSSAAGPDVRRLVLGSEGTLGVVTEVTLRVRRHPAVDRYEGWLLPDWESGKEALRAIAQDGPHPDVVRLSDSAETRVSMAMSGNGRLVNAALGAYARVRRVAGGCLLVLGYEGAAADVAYRRKAVGAVVRRHGGAPLGRRAGESWRHARFDGPALRDTLLDAGVLAETLETAATWSSLPGVYDAVQSALRGALGARVLVGTHISHVYATGASLYVTVLAAARRGDEAAQWSAAKSAVNQALVDAGATVTHHHGVGTAHRGEVAPDLGGDVGVAALRAVKAALDPAGVLNPGKLLPPM